MKGYSPLRRWVRQERGRDWPEERERQERARQLDAQGWYYQQRDGLYRRLDANGEPVDVYYVGMMR